jgi:hypothetical protein
VIVLNVRVTAPDIAVFIAQSNELTIAEAC